ncbi:cadherin repeat domain-containing protein [Comamonas endophytica]|uniref:cadherin repeat domain-containing protein n=1 Tax=Comamonas endophytica TaxID=2949090 RepID=UPI00360CAD54
MASGVFVDRAGNAYAGITSTTGLNFAMGGSIEVEPTVSSVSIGSTEEPGSVLNAGDIVYVTVTLSEAVLVTGAPRIALDIGGSTVYATYSSGSGTAALVFQYIIQAGQNAPGGIGTDSNALQLNGGTLKNAAGTDVMLAHGPAQNLDYQVDTVAPRLISGSTAFAIDENSGAGQIVYTAAATDINEVFYRLKPGADAEQFSIDARTGAVKLTGNPDYETKSSYSFTVVATDAAGNASEQAVTLAINDLDESAPVVAPRCSGCPLAEVSPVGATYTKRAIASWLPSCWTSRSSLTTATARRALRWISAATRSMPPISGAARRSWSSDTGSWPGTAAPTALPSLPMRWNSMAARSRMRPVPMHCLRTGRSQTAWSRSTQ